VRESWRKQKRSCSVLAKKLLNKRITSPFFTSRAYDIIYPNLLPRFPKSRYDYVLGPEAAQTDVYQQVQGCVPWVLEGYNSTIMAYGQTSSGKTHSMFGGSPASAPATSCSHRAGRLPEGAGVIPRAMHDLFVAIQAQQREPSSAASDPSTKTTVYCSFVQIYNEQLFDMLRDGGRDRPLEIHEDSNRDIYVQGLSEFRVKNLEECLALLRIGEDNRAIRETHMNQASSRSHSLFQVVVEQELGAQDPRRQHQQQAAGNQDGAVVILRSKLNLVDLAGSEKWDTTQDIADQHAQELANINSSLFTLGRCIAALCASASTVSALPAHIPYRESKLTRLIQDSLGGNTKTYIIATLSPTADCAEESISTLKFADRAKQVLTFIRPNEESPPVNHVLVEQLQREVTQLRALVLRLRAAPPTSSFVVTTASAASLDEEAAVTAAERRRREEAQAFHRQQRHALEASEARATTLEAALRLSQNEATDLRSALTTAHEQVAAQQQRLQKLEEEEGQRKRQQEEEDALQVDTSSNLRHRVREAEQRNHRFVSLLTRFFAFEIQEGDLRQALIDLVPNVDDYIGGKGASRHRVVLKDESLRRHSPVPSPLPHYAQPRSGYHDDRHQEHNYRRTNNESPRSSSQSPPPFHHSSPSLPPLQAPPPAMTYRIRGADGARLSPDRHAHDDSARSTPSSALYPHHLTEREEEEQRLVDQLNRARKRMQRHIKLQEWLIRKEQKELAAMEREENERRRAEDVRKETDERFRERARRQKKKLEAYYTGLRKSVGVAGEDGARGTITPPPGSRSLSATSYLSPLLSPPRFYPPGP